MIRLSFRPTRRPAVWARSCGWAFLPLLLVVLCLGFLPRVASGGQPTEASITEERFVSFDGTALAVNAWLPEGEPSAVILALHGFNDYSMAFDGAARSWAKRGFAVYAYDQRGFGDSTRRGRWAGTDLMIGDAKAALRALGRRYPNTPLFMIGESMGGAVLLSSMASQDPPRPDGVVLVAPAVLRKEDMAQYARVALWFAARLLPDLRVPKIVPRKRATDNDAILEEMSNDPLVVKEPTTEAINGLMDLMSKALRSTRTLHGPALVLYGRKETIVPKQARLQLLRDLEEAVDARHEVKIYPQGWHMLLRDLNAAVVHQDIADWIDRRRLASCRKVGKRHRGVTRDPNGRRLGSMSLARGVPLGEPLLILAMSPREETGVRGSVLSGPVQQPFFDRI